MDNLPLEILREIFRKLSLTQRQECLFVCRKWESIVRNRSLLSTAYVPNKEIYFEFIELLNRTPSLRDQVECLQMTQDVYSNYCDLMGIVDILPRLNLVELMNPDNSVYFTTDPIYRTNKANQEQLPMLPTHIEYIADYKECKFVRSLIDFDRCQYLITLKLRVGRYDNLSDDDIINLLKEVPTLKHLSLETVGITIDYCEKIHTTLPLLESLDLRHSEVWCCKIPENITPAINISKFAIDLGMMEDTYKQIDWPRYICQKYPYLSQLNISTKSFIPKNSAMNFFQIGFVPILQTFSTRLKSLNFARVDYYCDELLEKLDTFGWRLHDLNIQALGSADQVIEKIGQSNQANYIQKLVLNDLYPSSFQELKNMKVLKQLEINGKVWSDYNRIGKHIYLYNLIDSCPPTVDSVTIELSNVKTTLPPSYRQFKISKLNIKTSLPTKGMDEFISKCFPYLKSLTLNNCLMHNSSLKIPNCHLSYLGISHSGNISISILKDEKTYHYVTGNLGIVQLKDYTLLSNELAPISINQSGFNNTLAVTCSSVKTLVINSLPTTYLLRRS